MPVLNPQTLKLQTAHSHLARGCGLPEHKTGHEAMIEMELRIRLRMASKTCLMAFLLPVDVVTECIS